MVGLFVANSLFNLARSFRMQLLNARLAFGLRSRLFHRILRLPLSEITEMKTGGVITRLSSDVDNTTSLLQQALVSPLLSLVRLAATLSIIFTLNWKNSVRGPAHDAADRVRAKPLDPPHPRDLEEHGAGSSGHRRARQRGAERAAHRARLSA